MQTENNSKLTDLIGGSRKTEHDMLYSRYASSLFGLICRIVNNNDLAEDCLQKTFVEIRENMLSYEKSKLVFFTWASQIARRICRDAVKSIPVKNNTTFQCPEGCPEILKFVFWRGYSPEETAQIMNISVNEVKSGLRKALKTIRCL